MPRYSNITMLAQDFYEKKSSNKLTRIVFLLTLNGRATRQIFRLIKSIYEDMHFYYFHIDKVRKIFYSLDKNAKSQFIVRI